MKTISFFILYIFIDNPFSIAQCFVSISSDLSICVDKFGRVDTTKIEVAYSGSSTNQ